MPARTTRVILAATSPTTSTRRTRLPPVDSEAVRPSARSACWGWLRTKRAAGNRPQRRAQSSDAPMAKRTSGASMRSGWSRGRAEGRAWAIEGRAAVASRRPSRHPAAESRNGSATALRTNCAGLAPMAERTAASCSRLAARASNKLVMLTQPMRSTVATAARSMSSELRLDPVKYCCRPAMVAPSVT